MKRETREAKEARMREALDAALARSLYRVERAEQPGYLADDAARCYICGCESKGVADQLARTIARTLWQGYRVYVTFADDPIYPVTSFFNK